MIGDPAWFIIISSDNCPFRYNAWVEAVTSWPAKRDYKGMNSTYCSHGKNKGGYCGSKHCPQLIDTERYQGEDE